jgi:hypothetical protein
MLVNKIQILCVHCGTSCKITTPTDKNCGNESKICLASKNLPFYTPTFTFLINDLKTCEFWQPYDEFKKVSPECHEVISFEENNNTSHMWVCSCKAVYVWAEQSS